MGLPFLYRFLQKFASHRAFPLNESDDSTHTKIAIDCRYFLRVFIGKFFPDRTKGVDLSHVLYLFNQFFLGLKRSNISCVVFDGVSQRDDTNPMNDRTPRPLKFLRWTRSYPTFFGAQFLLHWAAVQAGHELRVYSGRYDSIMINSVVEGECSFCICRPVLIPNFSFAVLPNEVWNEVVHLFVSGSSYEPVFFEIYNTNEALDQASRTLEEIQTIDAVQCIGESAVREVFGRKWNSGLLEHLLKCTETEFSRYSDNIDNNSEIKEFVTTFKQRFVTSTSAESSLNSSPALLYQSHPNFSIDNSFYQLMSLVLSARYSSPRLNLQSRVCVDPVSGQSFTVDSFQRPLIDGIATLYAIVTEKPNCSEFASIQSNSGTVFEFIDSCASSGHQTEITNLPLCKVIDRIAERQPIAFSLLMSLRYIRLRQEFLNLQLFSECELFLLLISSFISPRQLSKVVSSELSFFQVQVAGSTLHRVVELLALSGFSSIWKVFTVWNLKFFSTLCLNFNAFLTSSDHLQNSVGLDNCISFLESLHVTTNSPSFILFRQLFSLVVLSNTLSESVETVENLSTSKRFKGINSLFSDTFLAKGIPMKLWVKKKSSTYYYREESSENESDYESDDSSNNPLDVIYYSSFESDEEVEIPGEEFATAITLELMKKEKKKVVIQRGIEERVGDDDVHIPRSKKRTL
ncbi:hypothetical protein GEMRC1_003979 [Eukaryota sp. GEM-RC1]